MSYQCRKPYDKLTHNGQKYRRKSLQPHTNCFSSVIPAGISSFEPSFEANAAVSLNGIGKQLLPSSLPQQTFTSISLPHISLSPNSLSSPTLPSSLQDPNFLEDEVNYLKTLYPPGDLVQDSLEVFAIKNNLSGVAVDELLYILRQNGFESLPKSHKTLRESKTRIDIQKMGEGTFFIRNLRKMLTSRLNLVDKKELKSHMFIDLSADGVPVGKSTTEQLWPYMVHIRHQSRFKPFVWASHSGSHKPSDPDLMLQEFNEQLMELHRVPIEIDGKQIIIHFHKFKGDLPSVALNLGVKNPGGYFACRYCFVPGTYDNDLHKVIYNDLNAPLRSDSSFRAEVLTDSTQLKKSERHVLRLSEFVLYTNFDLCFNVDLDAMHLALFGDTKKDLNSWFHLTKSKAKFSTKVRAKFEAELANSFTQFPAEFNRHGRPVKDVAHWKATEFKSFLLYTFMIVYPHMPKHIADHFMFLFCAMRILAHPQYYRTLNNLADKFLREYVKKCVEIYGEKHLDLSTHLLIHLASTAADNSLPIFEESCFRFENCIKIIKDQLKAGPLPLEQLANRLDEKEKIIDRLNPLKASKPILTESRTKIIFPNYVLSNKINDSYFMSIDKNIYQFLNPVVSHNQLFIKSKKILNQRPAFFSPIKSTMLDIFASSGELSDNYYLIPLENIQYKLFHLYSPDIDHVFLPLEHTSSSEFCN